MNLHIQATMKQKIYQIDAFADKVFSGNPAAVCPLDKWLSDDIMQKIAVENNLSETAFFVKTEKGFQIRWFTPKVEVPLCGHATLAAAYVLFELLNYDKNLIHFQSKSGELTVSKNDNWLTLNFPTDKIERIEISDELLKCFDKKPNEIYIGREDFMFVFSEQKDIENIQPDFTRIAQFENRGIIITARGNDTDFVSRYFAPYFGINEDPATGSTHTTLTTYWATQLNKTELTARQLSERGAYFKCKYLNERVEICGQAKLYLIGEIYL